MELLQLRYFRTAAQLENFSRAAEIHMIPQSAISKTIRKLEDELGCQLFDRNGKKIALNEKGILFLEHIDLALNAIDTAIEETRPAELKTVGIYIQSGAHFIPQLVDDFEHAYPDCKVILYQGESNSALNGDFTFLQLPIEENLYSYIVLMDDEIMLAAPKNSKWASKKVLNLSDLKNERFVSFDPKNLHRIFVDELCRTHGFVPHIVYEASTISALRSMIEANVGIGLIPSASWKLQESKHATIIPFKDHPTRQLALAWRKDLDLSPEKNAFLEFTKNWFSQRFPVNSKKS